MKRRKHSVETLVRVLPHSPDATLTMYGPDKGDGSLERVRNLARQHGIDSRVVIAGRIEKSMVPECLNRHDIFLNTTRYESFGVAIMEAAASGLPIVTTAVGEIPYLWHDGENALLVPDGDAEAMANAVVRILQEPGLAGTLSRNAGRKAESYDWSVVLPQWEKLYNSTLSQGLLPEGH